MSQNEIPDIDELLNSFLDGELDQRHQTEVKRLLKHDKRIAERLLALQKCKRLVSSLPYTEAPQELLDNIKASLEEKKPLVSDITPSPSQTLGLDESLEEGERDYAEGVQPARERQQRRESQGARHLLLRRLIAAAAMIALVAALAVVIYSIVVPEVTIDIPVAVEQPTITQPREAEPATVVATAEKPVEKIAPLAATFSGVLELKTASLTEVASFVNKVIELNVPSDQRSAAGPDKMKESHVLTCSRQNLRTLIADLGTIWDKFDSATLFVDTDGPEGQIVIDTVAPEQIIEIAKQDDFQTQIKVAKYFAVMNNMAERTPGREVLVAINNSTTHLMTIPKPVLTSSEKPVTKAVSGGEAEQKVSLTIVITGSE